MMKVWCVCRSLPWETLRNALQCHKYLRHLWCESRKYLFVCSSLYDDLLYFVSHGLAITPGNLIIYTKKVTIILTKDSGTRENVFYICMGDYDFLRFNNKMYFSSYNSPPEYWLGHSQWIFVNRLITESPSQSLFGECPVFASASLYCWWYL